MVGSDKNSGFNKVAERLHEQIRYHGLQGKVWRHKENFVIHSVLRELEVLTHVEI